VELERFYGAYRKYGKDWRKVCLELTAQPLRLDVLFSTGHGVVGAAQPTKSNFSTPSFKESPLLSVSKQRARSYSAGIKMLANKLIIAISIAVLSSPALLCNFHVHFSLMDAFVTIKLLD